MHKTITVEIKNNYGNNAIYPLCTTSKYFAEIAGTKTLTRHSIAIIKNMGYVIINQLPQSSGVL